MQVSARRFEGTTSLVTGAGGRIGSAISTRLAAEGPHVVVCDVNTKAAQRVAADITTAGHSAEARAFDLLDPVACAAAVEEVAALVAFLASDEAPFICGSVVEITGAQAVA
jgi:2-hydroxycyclohexanecarboxyl-CoA dehydrogenase